MQPNATVSNRFAGFLLAAAAATFLLLIAGTAVRVVDAAQACPDWPTCYGQVIVTALPAGADQTALALQLAHRALAVLAGGMVLAAAVWAARKAARLPYVLAPLALAALVMLAQALVGGGYVLLPGERPLLALLHMGLALLALGLVVLAAAAAFYARRPERCAPGLRAPFARFSVVVLAAVFVLMAGGTLLSASGGGAACPGWPLCAGGLPQSGPAWLAFAHRLVVLAAGLLAAAQFALAWRGQRSQPVLLPAATGVFLLLIGQAFIGAVKVSRGFPADLVGLHAAASAGLWALQVLLAAAAFFTARTPAEEAAERAEPLPLGARLKDFFILSKPVIVALLLVTTYAGMVVGGRAIPSFELAALTLLGGALAAGGSSALNQYIDRETDRAMQRTANRPLPGQRLKPAEALAYGLGACLAAFFLLAGTVNLLAAVLSLAGMIYYVLIYSVWLKHVTVQNIVIGGGAGALPPLVGWAAATGSLNVPALFLFAIIFFWTPPHFWALALVRRSDYARGRVPMLPVVRGEAETRRQIMIYTLQLVGLTLLLPIFNMAGTIYLVSALALGLWLIHTAYRVYRYSGNKPAWKMYRYSSMYLMFLMIAMVVDVLV